ncbi:hypothetical protein CDL12_21750 [Handroanthus impetiginosus]|uniref:F-box domain-containing protein n=1 Tax=Handroanthus impetiginosus TaxID=429701 RepID=A0A2G9GK99_9LAMI|nr:hypothetical protein CDL12_21750 [Handroanthus impetiginosus]
MKRPRTHEYPTSSKSQKKTKNHEDDDQDRLSMLPEPILHHILSYLPTKDATKTSVLSKTFNSAWKSSPVLDFNQYSFQKYSRKNAKTQRRSSTVQDFCNYVDRTISNRDLVQTGISKFQVVVNFNSRNITSYHKNLDRWLNYAMDNNVQELILAHHLSSRAKDHQWGRYVLPESPFRAKSLENLDLFGCQFPPNNGNIGLVSLKKLKLSRVYIDQETLQNILSTCCHLEELEINLCEGFEAIKVSGLSLKKVDLYLARDRVQNVVISAPNLEFLSYGGGCANVQSSLERSNNFQSLKELILHDVDITDGFFRVIPQFPQLEKMELARCCFLESVRISNVRVLGCLSIYECFRIKEIELHVSCLSCFRYDGVMYESPGDMIDVSDKFKVFRI